MARMVVRMIPFRRVTLRIVCPALVLAAAACSSSSGSGAASGTASSAASSPPAAGSAAPSSAGSAASSQTPVPAESNPPGDIPDNVAFVPYTNAAAGYSFTHPEGWAEQENGAVVTFTDKLNGIHADTESLPTAFDEATARQQEIPRLSAAEPAFELVSVSPESLPAGRGVVIVYRRNSAPDPVTGRQVRDEVQEHLVSTGTSSLRLALFGPVGADNVDAYRTISQSLALP
jgi:hypothetical protein